MYGKNKITKQLLDFDSSYELIARGDAADGFLVYHRVVPLSYITGAVMYCASKAKEKKNENEPKPNQIVIQSQFPPPSLSSSSFLLSKQKEQTKEREEEEREMEGKVLTTMSVEGMFKWAQRKNNHNSNNSNNNSNNKSLKVAVVSVAVGKNESDMNDYLNKPWVQFAIHNHQSYCQLHGYSYHLKRKSSISNIYNNNEDTNNTNNSRTPHWEKVRYLKSIMTQMNDSVDYILWMDMDSIFTITSISIEHIV